MEGRHPVGEKQNRLFQPCFNEVSVKRTTRKDLLGREKTMLSTVQERQMGVYFLMLGSQNGNPGLNRL